MCVNSYYRKVINEYCESKGIKYKRIQIGYRKHKKCNYCESFDIIKYNY